MGMSCSASSPATAAAVITMAAAMHQASQHSQPNAPSLHPLQSSCSSTGAALSRCNRHISPGQAAYGESQRHMLGPAGALAWRSCRLPLSRRIRSRGPTLSSRLPCLAGRGSRHRRTLALVRFRATRLTAVRRMISRSRREARRGIQRPRLWPARGVPWGPHAAGSPPPAAR